MHIRAVYIAIVSSFLLSFATRSLCNSQTVIINDTLESQKVLDQQISYYFEDHNSESLASSWNLSRTFEPMIGMSLEEQDSFIKQALPNLLAAPYLNAERVSKQTFTPKDQYPFNQFVASKYIWYKFSLVYQGSRPRRSIIIKPGLNCNYCFLYSQSKDSKPTLIGYTGRVLPKGDSAYSYTGNFFSTRLMKGQVQTFYLLAQNRFVSENPQLISKKVFLKESNTQTILEAIVLGAGFMAILYYGFLGFYSKEPAYIHFNYFLICFILFFLSYQSLSKLHPLFSILVTYPALTTMIHILVYSSTIRFMLSYLQVEEQSSIRKTAELIIKTCHFFAFGLIPLSQIGFFDRVWVGALFVLLVFGVCSYIMVVMIHYCLKRERTGYIYTAVMSTVTVSVLINYCYYFHGSSNEFIAAHYNLVRFSFLFAITIFSLEMGTRLKIAKSQAKIKNMFISSRVEHRIASQSDFMDWEEESLGFILCLDLRGFTRFTKNPDNALACKEIIRSLNSIVRKSVKLFGGEVHKTIGDGFLCYFIDESHDSSSFHQRSMQLLNIQSAFEKVFQSFEEIKKQHDVRDLDLCGAIDFGVISFQVHGDSDSLSLEYDISGQVVTRAYRLEEYTKCLRKKEKVTYLLISQNANQFYSAQLFKDQFKTTKIEITDEKVRDYPEIKEVYAIKF